MKSVEFEQFDAHAGMDYTGVATAISSLNASVMLVYQSTASFFGVHVKSTPLKILIKDGASLSHLELWEAITLNLLADKVFNNNTAKVQYIENVLGETERKTWMQWRLPYPTEYEVMINTADDAQNLTEQLSDLKESVERLEQQQKAPSTFAQVGTDLSATIESLQQDLQKLSLGEPVHPKPKEKGRTNYQRAFLQAVYGDNGSLSAVEFELQTQIDNFYQERKSERDIMVRVAGSGIPQNGAGYTLSKQNGAPTSPVPITFSITFRSRAYVLGKLVKTKFYESINCTTIMGPNKMNTALPLSKNCTYS
ncbi:hypothetical protein AKJ16_DCAP03422 [Drosera capensis]